MRKFLTFLTAFAVFATSFAASSPESKPSALKADQIFIPIGNSGAKISLEALSTIKIKTLVSLTGNKMGFFDRMAFKAAQKKLRNNINPDGTITNRKLTKRLNKAAGGETGFHFGGFALGFLLGPIGVIIAYLIKDEKKKNRVKWSWIGWAAWVVFYLALIL